MSLGHLVQNRMSLEKMSQPGNRPKKHPILTRLILTVALMVLTPSALLWTAPTGHPESRKQRTKKADAYRSTRPILSRLLQAERSHTMTPTNEN